MKHIRLSMARCAMVFVTLAAVLLAGCGDDGNIYEAVRTVQSESTGSVPADITQLNKEDHSTVAAGDMAADGVTEQKNIYVYVCGAVVRPGVYTLPEDARVCDAIDMAGGFAENADRVHTNLAEKVTDGRQITVPTREEAENMPLPAENAGNGDTETGSGKGTDGGLVNINTADSATLQTLSGIGESRAADIIAWREENGGFTCIEDITKVSGIGDKMFQKIKDKITV